jgi:hypothetical protein
MVIIICEFDSDVMRGLCRKASNTKTIFFESCITMTTLCEASTRKWLWKNSIFRKIPIKVMTFICIKHFDLLEGRRSICNVHIVFLCPWILKA